MTQQQPMMHQHSTTRPGQMTAVMRAAAATGPKVLRIGVVLAGRVIEERIIKQRVDVTVGPSEKSMFVTASDATPGAFRLFELVGGEYCINFLDNMSGRIALPTGISELSSLRGSARRLSDGGYQLRLTDECRGKIVVGDRTFLFQFVAPPPVQPKPQLPVAVLRGASSVDWPTTMIAAFSFLLHFLGIGSLYSDWMDPVVDEDGNLANLVESVRNLPAPPPVEQPTENTEVQANKAEEKAEAPKSGATKGGGAAGAAGGAKMTMNQAAALAREMEALEMATIAALTGAGPATAGVLTDGQVATSALDQAAATSAGVSSGVGGLNLSHGGGAIRPGATGGGLASIGMAGKTEGTQGTGAVAKVAGPKGRADVGGASVAGGAVANASRVVAGMRAGFRNCFNRELASNPDAQGTIRLTIKVGPGGEVQNVAAVPSGSLGSAVECVKARARSAQFDAPEGGSAVIVVPVTFVKQ